jgi:signal transduction histidine kinase
VSVVLAACGWGAAALLGLIMLVLARRLELAARAEHELRGPVTVLRLALERLELDPGACRHAPLLEAQLERLCAGLADLAAALSGRRTEPRRTEVDLARLLRGAVEGWRAVLGRGGRELRLRWQLSPGRIQGDPGRLAQAVGNLLANAARHNVTFGTIELRSWTESDWACLVTANDGPAVAGQDIERLFAPFVRGREPETPGTGLGLTIVRAIVQAHGGTVEARARPRGGLEVTLRLPRARP